MLLPFLATCGIIDPSEGFYAEAGREMAKSGNYLTPYLNYQPWYLKPILIHWLTSASISVIGVNAFAARLPAALSASLLVLFTYIFARQFVRRRPALLSAGILAASPLFSVVGRLCLTDMPFTLCLSGALYAIFLSLFKNKTIYRVTAAVFLGLAVLVKGPLALFLSLMIVGLFFLVSLRGHWQEYFWRLSPFKTLAIAALVALPWYVGETIASKGAFIQEFFFRQNFARLSGNLDHNQPIWYYVPFLAGGFFPWILLLPANRWSLPGQSKNFSHIRLLGVYLGIWTIAVCCFFSLVPSKMPTYILPALPALAILCGISLDLAIFKRSASFISQFLRLDALFLSLALIVQFFLMRATPQLCLLSSFVVALLLSACLVLGQYAGKLPLSKIVYLALALAVLGTTCLVPLALQRYYIYHQQEFQKMVHIAGANHADVAIIGPDAPSCGFYLQHKISYITVPADVQSFLGDGQKAHYVFIERKQISQKDWFDVALTPVAHEKNWYLFKTGN